MWILDDSSRISDPLFHVPVLMGERHKISMTYFRPVMKRLEFSYFPSVFFCIVKDIGLNQGFFIFYEYLFPVSDLHLGSGERHFEMLKYKVYMRQSSQNTLITSEAMFLIVPWEWEISQSLWFWSIARIFYIHLAWVSMGFSEIPKTIDQMYSVLTQASSIVFQYLFPSFSFLSLTCQGYSDTFQHFSNILKVSKFPTFYIDRLIVPFTRKCCELFSLNN